MTTPLTTFGLESPQTFSSNSNYYGENLSLDQSSGSADHVSALGAFNYTIPIEVPAGVNGMTPEIFLSYSSQNQNNSGIYGYGWSDSIPYIERQNKTGVNNMYDEFFFESSISGDLTAVSINKDGKGTYTAREESQEFLQYQQVNDSSWEVYTVEGTVYAFGKEASHRLVNPGDQEQITKWYLSSIQDRYGNRITYTYQDDATQVYPKTITYTDYTDKTGEYAIDFMYVPAPSYTSYSYGYPVITDQGVTQIDISYQDTIIKSYDFSHSISPDSGRSLLTSYDVIGYEDSGDTVRAGETVFTYSESNLQFERDEDFPALPVESSTDLWKNNQNQYPILFLDHDIWYL